MRFKLALLAALTLVPAAAEAQTPWALLARRAIGRVEHMQQMQPDQNVGADVASVVVSVPAERVYARVLATIRANPALRLLSEDAANARVVVVSNGARNATISVAPLTAELTKLLIVSTYSRGEAPEASRVLANILHLCAELHVSCSAQ